eukprot:scaffold2819_cov128-Isochrysis_galbana.AAC.6
MLRQVEVDFDQNNLSGASRAEAERLIAKLRTFEVSRTGRDTPHAPERGVRRPPRNGPPAGGVVARGGGNPFGFGLSEGNSD